MLLITFSGLDGCGKSTHVARTCAYLRRRQLRVRRLTTLAYSATGVQTVLRERRRDRARRRNRPPVPPHPLHVRTYPGGRTFDEDRRNRWVRWRRIIAYPLDCLVLRVLISWFRWTGYDAVVCDRYVADKLVALVRMDGLLARLLRRIAPHPDHAFLLDTPPDEARARRCEHELDYYITKCNDYRRLAAMNVGLVVIRGTSIDDVQQHIESVIAAEPNPRHKSANICHTHSRPA